ncbi:hypothetical protein [Streptomyces sp. NPDC007264]|uniref:hypothetical protein n=1 Tax=Streptomyces sp. NPDC007264 TaxID=3364777 RepID=UPI0036DCBB2A
MVAVCPVGQKAISGGWVGGNEVVPVLNFRSTSPGSDPDGSWTVSFHNLSTTQTYFVRAAVYCVPS